MLGMAKGAGGFQSPPSAPDITVSITPDSFFAVSSNGSYTTPFFKSIVSNGVGPFTYSWSFDAGNINAQGSEKTRLTMSGYNELQQGVLRLTVTDTGDSNKTATASANVLVTFEDFYL
tara:strand:- start:36000 stop:36353 length:354 start_codon:yes stop_codon:yes gene_type:complete